MTSGWGQGVTFQLHGLPCHECGQPAERFTNGITSPCGCGALYREHLLEAAKALLREQEAEPNLRAQQLQREPVERVSEAPMDEEQAWVEILTVFKDIVAQ